MKKLMILTLGYILLFALTTTVWGATREIAVTSVTGSANTAATGPVQYLTDGKTDTGWGISEQTPVSAWAELQLAEMVQIEGLQIYGPFTGDLTVEYWLDGAWHPFITGSMKANTATSGWNLLDLSYDRVVTGKLRVQLTNPNQLKQIGGIGELKVLGEGGTDILERLEPVSVTTNRQAETGRGPENLFDHNTYSGWWMYAAINPEAGRHRRSWRNLYHQPDQNFQRRQARPERDLLVGLPL